MSETTPSPLPRILPKTKILGSITPSFETILTPEAMKFVTRLERRFRPRREALLARRRDVQTMLDHGWMPDFLQDTKDVRESEWRIDPVPANLRDRRVEITGPVDRKMIINAMNSGANVFMADFEDSNSPTWWNIIEGQVNLWDAVRGVIEYVHPVTGREYRLEEKTATLVVRPRGWHLEEKHVLVDGKPVSASLLDFGLFFFHNAKELIARGSGPYFYLPKLENHLEARLWNEVFLEAQDELGLPRGTIKATVLIETILAVFEMHEILWDLREHAAGLNCGRWDYIFSFIKKFRSRPDFVLPNRDFVTMDQHFLRSYSRLLIQTCHRRGAHAIGGMAAQIPIKDDLEKNRLALEKVRADKRREAIEGHDGTWVAHPGLVDIAREEFDAVLGERPHQIDRKLEDFHTSAMGLLIVPVGSITKAGLRHNVRVGIRYLESWLRGSGCVPIFHLMEDAATAEISRTQVWQWVRHRARMEGGRLIDAPLVRSILREEARAIRDEMGESAWKGSRFRLAVSLFEKLITAPELDDFLTTVAYPYI